MPQWRIFVISYDNGWGGNAQIGPDHFDQKKIILEYSFFLLD